MLVDIVSLAGICYWISALKLMFDPAIMEERLLQIGDWLKIMASDLRHHP